MKNLSSATTRSNGKEPVRLPPTGRLLSPGQTIKSPESQLSYEVERFLGAGGFGQVYLARRVGRSSVVAETVCIKVSGRIDGWLREAYFGQLLEGHPRAIRIYDAFPLPHPDGGMLYYLALEYARHGDLRSFVYRGGESGGGSGRAGAGWPERTVRREIAGILEVLRKLHRGQMLHRDLTPMNVFVCDGPSLKLGDFGIVRQQSDTGGIKAGTMNALTAPSDILAGMVPKWQARDDVYQVGQLLGMLVKGDASARLRTSEIRHLPCGDHLKEIIHRCIGERHKRYSNADDLIGALRTPPASLKAGALRSLAGARLVFTGILTKPRIDAAKAARKAGALVQAGPSVRTTVIVRGRPNPLQAAGKDAGLKLMEIKRLRALGYRITLLNERQFWKLAIVKRAIGRRARRRGGAAAIRKRGRAVPPSRTARRPRPRA